MSKKGQQPIQIPAVFEVFQNLPGLSTAPQSVALHHRVRAQEIVHLSLPSWLTVRIQHQSDGSTILYLVATRALTQKEKTQWGTLWEHLAQMVASAQSPFGETLHLRGVGYRVAKEEQNLVLRVGLSHEVEIPIPASLNVNCPTRYQITASGSCKHEVTQWVSQVRKVKPPEPYKGKGMFRQNETIRQKEGKKKG